MYRFQFSNGLQFGPYPTQLQSALSDSFIWLDTLSWTKGKHSVRLGGEFDHTSIRRNLPVLDNGLLYFLPGADSTLSPFQNFALGEPTFGEEGGGASNHVYIIPDYSAFVQDDYRLTQSLTLNLGLRAEWEGAASDNDCHLGNSLYQNAPVTGNAYVYPSCVNKYGFSGLSGNLQGSATNNEYATVIQPRIGFAYDVAGDHKTVVRGGYGIYSVREDIGGVDNLAFPLRSIRSSSAACQLAPPEPWAHCSPRRRSRHWVQVSATFVPRPQLLHRLLRKPDTTSSNFSGTAINYFFVSVPLHWIVPTTQQWNLTVQRQLGRELGSRSRIRGHQGHASALCLRS